METSPNIIQDARDHAIGNVIEINGKRRRCVDGGYTAEQADGSMAIPGGDQGTVMALASMGRSPQEAFDIVYGYVTEQGWKFGYHTDTHCEHDDSISTGCGHCQAAINGDRHELYGITGEQAAEVQEIIEQKTKEAPDTIDCIILDREHAEKAILAVLSMDWTVNPWDQAKDVQYFVYDKSRHLAYLGQIAAYATEQGHEVDEQALIDAAEKQTNATLGLLGSSKGKPIISVEFDENGENPTLEHIGDAPDYTTVA